MIGVFLVWSLRNWDGPLLQYSPLLFGLGMMSVFQGIRHIIVLVTADSRCVIGHYTCLAYVGQCNIDRWN